LRRNGTAYYECDRERAGATQGGVSGSEQNGYPYAWARGSADAPALVWPTGAPGRYQAFATRGRYAVLCGRSLKRGWGHFFREGTRLENPADVWKEDDYREKALRAIEDPNKNGLF